MTTHVCPTTRSPSSVDSLRALGIAWLAIGFLALAMCGCGSGDGREEVSGGVTLDGTPLDAGVISFAAPDARLPAAEAAITDGAYEIPADKGLRPGHYRVAIDSADTSGKTASPTGYPTPIPISRIPIKYNGETVLSADVTEAGDNRFDFALESGR